MALVDHEQMTDATGAVHLYTAAPKTANPSPPKYPHPDAELVTNNSGRRIHPFEHHKPLAGFLEYLRVNGGEFPVDGDWTARMRRMQCWDPLTNRGLKSYTGTETCEEPSCPHPQPHVAGQWISDNFPRFRDIAHVLYPEGRVPWPLGYRGPRIYSGGWSQWQPFKDYAADEDRAPRPDDAPVDVPPAPAEPSRPIPVQLDLLDHLTSLEGTS